MSVPTKSEQELFDLWLNVLLDEAPDLTDTNEGAILVALGDVFAVAGTEIEKYIVDSFNTTFFDLANGPEITGGPDDLQTLAVDHYGDAFARPGAIKAIDIATFSRATTTAGNISIPQGTIIKTKPDANGQNQRYVTNATVVMTGTSVSVGITAVVAGAASSASSGTITVIESSLLDPTIVVTNAGNATGADAQNDATYRETIRNLIEALRGATIAAIEAAARTVAGIVTATFVELDIPVIEYDIATGAIKSGVTFFRIPRSTLYIGDSTGTANAALIAAVKSKLITERAAGVKIDVLGASAVSVNWTAAIALNPTGPNFTELSVDPTLILDSMTAYIQALPVGTGFIRSTADAAILAQWGASGTNDLTSFSTSVPSGDITATASQKLVAGTMVVT